MDSGEVEVLINNKIKFSNLKNDSKKIKVKQNLKTKKSIVSCSSSGCETTNDNVKQLINVGFVKDLDFEDSE